MKRGGTRRRRGSDSESSGGGGSDPSDSEARYRSRARYGRRDYERDGRDKDRDRRRGSERHGLEKEQGRERPSKRLEEEEKEDGRWKGGVEREMNGHQDSDLEMDRKRSERRDHDQPRKKDDEEDNREVGNRKGGGNRKTNGRRENDSESSGEERDRKRGDRREKEQPKKRLDDVEVEGDEKERNIEVTRDKRRDERNKRNQRKGSDSESSGEERDRKRSEGREREQRRKRSDEAEEDGKGCNAEGRHGKRSDEKNSRMGHRGSDSENSGEVRDRKRSEGREKEQPRQRSDEAEEDGKERNAEGRHGKRSDEKNRWIGRQGSDSENSGEVRNRKRSEGREREQHRKRSDEAEEDGKERNIEGRHGKRRDERSRRNGRRGSDTESSGREDRRQDRDRERRRRERKHRYDSTELSDSDGHRRRHSTRRSERREDRTGKQRRDLEDGELRSSRDKNEKAPELMQGSRDVKEEEAAKPQTQPTAAEMNPVGDLGTLGRTGGVYIPPFKLARMMKEIEDKSSVEYQRLTWDALRKSINGLVNKVNATNIKNIIPELLGENLIRGRGLFCRSCMKSQMASPGFTDVFAALVAVVNTKFPEIGNLLLKRIILQLKRAYKRNDKPQLLAAVKFIAHLVNQQVAHELVALELLTILLEQPTDDSVEVAVDFVKECGSILQDLCPKGLHGIFERFRGILHEGEIDKRVQFLIEGLFAIRKAKFQGHPAVRPELDLVEPEDQLTHELSLEDDVNPETGLDIFKKDPNFTENERRYEELKKSILGEESEDEDGSDAGSEDDEDDEEDDEDDEEQQMQIKDETETNLINLRRTIYLTIMSSVDFEEAGHKLLKIKLEPGQEMELCIMLLECCSQERTYLRYYGLLGQRFCMYKRVYQENFDKCFVQQYSMIHRLETNKLRNVAKFFAHLLGTDALPWHVLAYIRLTEEDTTSSSRIFIKILFQELAEHLGIKLLNERLNDASMQDSYESIFPKDNPRNTRFAINFFTSIGLGGITENLREYLKNMPRMIMQQQKPESEAESDADADADAGSGSGSESSSSGSGSTSADTDSDSSSEESSSSDDDRRKKRKKADSGGGGSRDRKRRKGDE